MKIVVSILVFLMLFSACSKKRAFNVDNIMESKIKFDLTQLDKDGLSGPDDGKRSISYEFCIPDNKINRDKVKKIDISIQFTKAMGRSMCGKNQILCMGNTHQPNSVKVLERLSKLTYIEKITETYFE
ncbi:MAG: hypothetical protein IPO45_09020 [Saprospiraceae bacterium]|jgi:hypothetical protein|uniref:hypothetical protein n=1 Tax=Candidatus Brachybacter algidus TaxID=2982024 RepID=UPI001B4E8920|nr:hypothetical protein [Candidatus Brachybacter algidus]MBP7306502.1 hypothetical protein [Saprospiraceae bacterium]MBK6373232.1 hypothetical protein [Candidatus Brachybacter algidus]MBK6447883.1 hypothetical protein [Candidatus Brachybacter algidus]MBK8746915.1 hypothetical protein [Candidatus Brachybacter algidus]MBK8843777.1 hypothetical protein [Candidatus Brachybacter algidus]